MSEVERRVAMRCTIVDEGFGVRRLNDVAVCQRVDLLDEVSVQPPGVLREIELLNKPKVSRYKNDCGEFMKAGEALRWNGGTVIENH